MLLVVGSTGEKPPAGVRESWLFIFLPSDYAPGEVRCGHPKPYRLTARPQPERKIEQQLLALGDMRQKDTLFVAYPGSAFGLTAFKMGVAF